MQVDFIGLLQSHGIPYDTKQNQGWANIDCPICLDSPGKHHGGFNLSGGYYHCWKCGGSDLDFIFQKLFRTTDEEIAKILAQYSGRLSISARLNKRTAKAKDLILPGDSLTPPYRKYLQGRGFSPKEIVTKYGVTAGGITGDWRFRLMIPFFYRGQLVTYQGRDITGKQKLRYKTLDIEQSVIDPKTIFYNLDNVKSRRVGVCEGVVDTWRMGDSFIASMGTSLTAAQVGYLGRNFDEVLFLFDPEPIAQKKALAVANSLSSMGVKVSIVDLEIDRDPGELSPAEALEIRKALNF